MNITSFNQPFKETSKTPFPPSPSHPQSFPATDQAHLIIQRLGKELGFDSQLTSPKIDCQNVHTAVESKAALRQLLQKVDGFIKTSNTLDKVDSEGIHQLETEIHQLESRLAEMRMDKTLSKKESQHLQTITRQLHGLLTVLPNWAKFQSAYFDLDTYNDDILTFMTPTTMSALHGCSPQAVQAMQESLRCLQELIQLSAEELMQPNHPFAPEIGGQLASSINATSWCATDGCAAIISRSDKVFDQALNCWDQAANEIQKNKPTLSQLAKMNEAASLIQSQQAMLSELDNSLPGMQKVVEECLAQLPGVKKGMDSADYRRLERQLKQVAQSLEELHVEMSAKQQHINQALASRPIENRIQQARAAVDPETIEQEVQQILADYHPSPDHTIDEAIKHYTTTKRALMGFDEVSKTAKLFCQKEEVRLTAEVDSPVDFEGMVHALVLQELEKPPGLVGRLLQTIHPDNWSKSTKRKVGTFFNILQLSSHVLGIYQQLPEKTLSAADRKTLAKETTWLSSLMSKEKYSRLSSKQAFENLTKRAPEIRETLQAVLSYYPPDAAGTLPKELQNQLLKSYENYRRNILLGRETSSPSQWVAQLETLNTPTYQATLLRLPDKPSLNNISEVAEEALASSFANPSEQLNQAATTLKTSQKLVRQCERMEYLQPKTASTPVALTELRNAIGLMQKSLRETMLKQPKTPMSPDWATWNAAVANQCHAVKDLEQQVEIAMSNYDEAMALSTYQQEEEAVHSKSGNKHLNLIKMANLQAALNLDGIEIPVPKGVDSQQVHQFLHALAPEVFTEWNALRDLYAGYKEKEPFVKTPQASAHLNTIAEAIRKAFNTAATNAEAFQALGLSEEIKNWLNTLADEGHFLMVRSTGAEDSKQSANAGGNISVAYVEPTQAAFCEALGQVVASYFGAGSLQNRLNVDLNPFEEDLKLAVTTQQLIGEPIGGTDQKSEIPISLVLFTNEPLYYNGEEFRAMRLSATYGHGEGVVGNQGIGSDTVLILHSVAHPDQLYYQYDNQAKPTRLAPKRDPVTGKVSLQKIANPTEFSDKRALSPELLVRLFEWGIVGEKFFGAYPTDMEIVIKNNKIYPVQARPVNRPTQLPTYIDPKKIAAALENPLISTLKLKMITPGKASVVEISNPQEIVTAETLEKAEKQFDKEKHKLVIVSQSEPANSHPVVNFSSMGIPCLWTSHLDQVEEITSQITSEKGVAVCVQSSRLFLGDKSKGDLADFVSQGYVVHPAQVSESLIFTKSVAIDTRVSPTLPEEISTTFFRLQTEVSRQSALEKLQALKTSEPLQNFQKKLKEIEKIAAEEPLQAEALKNTLKMAQALDVRLKQAFDEVEALLTNPHPSSQMELLLHVKILESLFFQTTETSTGIASQSLATLQAAFAAADALIAYQQQLTKPHQFGDLLMDGTQSVIEGFYEEWQSFLLELEQTKVPDEDILRFKDVLQTMRRTGTLPLFATFFFDALKKETALQTLHAINALLPISEQPLINQLLSHHEVLIQQRNDINSFSDPNASTEAWQRLQTTIMPFLPPQNAWMEKAQWDTLSPITRSIAIQTMNEIIDIYDLSIKAMKASPEFNDEKKVQEFKKMLGPYLQLFSSWSLKTVFRDENEEQEFKKFLRFCLELFSTWSLKTVRDNEAFRKNGFVTHMDWPLTTYLSRMEEIYTRLLNSPDDPSLMRPSRDFSVSAATLGAGTAFERHFPVTLEDIFTLIHQNLLATTSVLLKQSINIDLTRTVNLPTQLLYVLNNARAQIEGNNVGSPQLIGLEISAHFLKFNFNVPLRNHSGKFSIEYERQTQKTTMQAQILGEARNRWRLVLERATLLSKGGLLPLNSTPKLSAQEVTFSWDITHQKSAEEALKEYKTIAVYSLLERFTQEEILDFGNHLLAHGNLRAAVWPPNPLEKGDFTNIANRLLSNQVMNNLEDPLHKDLEYLKYLISEEDPSIQNLLTGCHLKLKGNAQGSKTMETKYPLDFFDFDTSLEIIAHTLLSPSQNWRNEAKQTLLELTAQGNQEAVDKLIAITEITLKLSDRDIRVNMLEMLKALLAQGYGVEAVQRMVNKNLIDNDPNVRLNILSFFQALLPHTKDFERAIQIVRTYFDTSHADGQIKTDGQIKSLDLITTIVNEAHGLEEISQMLLKIFSQKQGPHIRNKLLSLFSALFIQGHSIKECEEMANAALSDDDSEVRLHGLELFTVLLPHTQEFEKATLLARAALLNRSSSTSEKGLKLFIALLQQGQGFEEATQAAKDALISYYKSISDSGLELFKALLQQGQGFEEATQAAKDALIHRDRDVSNNGLELFKALFQQGRGFEEATQAAKGALIDDRSVHAGNNGVKLFKALFQQGQGFEEATQMATAALIDRTSLIKDNGLQLFKALVEQGQSFGEAIQAAKDALIDDDGSIRDSGLQLFKALVQQGQGIDEAKALIASDLIAHYLKNGLETVLKNVIDKL